MRTLQAFDVDNDALADALETIAAGIRDGDVGVQEVESNHRARVDDPSEFFVGLRFVADHSIEDAVDPIEYETDDGGDE